MRYDPLGDEFLRELPYPADALPPVIRDAVDGFCAKSLLPVNVVASSALFAVATAVQTAAIPGIPPEFCYGKDRPRESAGLFFLTITDYGHQRKLESDKTFTRLLRKHEVVFTHWSLGEALTHLGDEDNSSVGIITDESAVFRTAPKLDPTISMRGFCCFWDREPPPGDYSFEGTHLSVSLRMPFLALASFVLDNYGEKSFHLFPLAERFLECFLIDFYDGPVNVAECIAHCDGGDLHCFHLMMAKFSTCRRGQARTVCFSPAAIEVWRFYAEEYESRSDVLVFSRLAPLHILRLAVVLSVFSKGFEAVTSDFVSAAHKIVRWYMVNASKLGFMLEQERLRWWGERKPKIY